MNERDWADRFSRDVDGLLNEAGRTDSEPSPTEYRQALDLACTMATTDFSDESRARQRLRRRLLSRIGAREEEQRWKMYALHALFWRRHPAATLTVVLLATLLVSTLVLAVYPQARAAAQETLERVVPLYCVVRTGEGYVVYGRTRGALGLMLWKPITPPLPPNPLFYVMDMSAGPGVCPGGPGAILWGYAKIGLLLASLILAVTLSVYSPTRAKVMHGIKTLGGWVWRLRKSKEYPRRAFFCRRRPVVTLAAVVLIALLVITLAWPGALTPVAQGIESFVRSLVLGRYTAVYQVGPEQATPTGRTVSATPVVERQDDGWLIRTSIGDFGGSVLPGRDVTVQRFGTFDEAQAAVHFRLRQPMYLPTGYALREAMIAPNSSALLFYGGPSGDIILVQMPVGEQRVSSEAGHVTTIEITTTTVLMLTDKPIESVTLNGQPAGWIEGRGLQWEAGGVSYTLGGANLSLDEAIRFAESLE